MSYETRDPVPLRRAASIAVIAWLVVSALSGLGDLVSIVVVGQFQAGRATIDDLTMVDTFTQISAILYIATYLPCAFLVLRWIYRVNKNAHVMSDRMSVSPGWNVGFFFIPFLGLYYPFKGLRETWQASGADESVVGEDAPGLLRIWWAAWLICNVLGNIAFRLSLASKTLDDLTVIAWINLCTVPFDVIAGVALLAIMRRITMAQSDWLMAARDEINPQDDPQMAASLS